MTTLRHVLEASVIGASPTPILSVPSTDSVTDVFATLVRHNILSAPVFNASTQTFVGIIDILDLLMLFTEVFSRSELQALSSLEAIASNQMRFTKEQFNRYFANHTRFVQAAQINDMAGLSGVNPFVPVQEGENLWNILGLMVERHLHRVPVMRSEKELVNYITQSSVMQVIHENISLLDESVRSKTVGELKLGRHEGLIIAQDSDRAIDVFAIMSQQGISAVPVVDESRKFVGVISASDIKGIGTDCSLFPRLSLTVLDYVAPIRQANLKARYPAIAVHPSDTIERLINKLAATRVHRLILTDPETSRVLAVISLTDVLRYVHEALSA